MPRDADFQESRRDRRYETVERYRGNRPMRTTGLDIPDTSRLREDNYDPWDPEGHYRLPSWRERFDRRDEFTGHEDRRPTDARNLGARATGRAAHGPYVWGRTYDAPEETRWNRAAHQEHTDFAGVGPRGYRRKDDYIRDEVVQYMTEDPDLDPSEIDIQVQDAEVTLEGTVGSRSEKRHAEDVAYAVYGVQDVHNRLRVVQRSDS